jgi:type III secretory pathway lipoprotein EscJ
MKWAILLSSILLLSCGKEVVLSNLDEYQANKAVVVLNKHGIRAEKVNKNGVFEVVVPERFLAYALEVVTSKNSGFQPQVQLKKSQTASEEEKNFYFERMLARELEVTLEKIPQVALARVHLYLPKYPGLSLKKLETEHSKASVLIMAIDPKAIDQSSLKKVVSGASGVKEENIIIQIMHADNETIYTSGPPKSQSLVDDLTKSLSVFKIVGGFVACFCLIALLYAVRRNPKI